MNILITGGNGFVGQHLISELSKNNKISVICRKKHDLKYIDIEKFKNVKVHYGADILDYNKILPYFGGMDAVFNLAGYVSFKQKDRKKLIAINKEGTLNVLNACREHNIKKIIHISSTAALGFSNKAINEESTFNWKKYKKCVYSYSKHLPEKWLLDSQAIIAYPSLILGPGDYANTLKLITAVKEKKAFNMPGRNSVIDVRDLTKALLILLKKGIPKNKYIIAGRNYSFHEINSTIARQLNTKKPGISIPREFESAIKMLARLYEKFSNNPAVTYENIFFAFKNRIHDDSKIRALGFKQKYLLDQTIKDAIIDSTEKELL